MDPAEAWPPGSKVVTLYGPAVIERFRAEDGMYWARLPYGFAALHPNVIFGAEQLSSSALYVSQYYVGLLRTPNYIIFSQAIGVTGDASSGKDRIYNVPAPSENIDPNLLVKDPCKVFFGTQVGPFSPSGDSSSTILMSLCNRCATSSCDCITLCSLVSRSPSSSPKKVKQRSDHYPIKFYSICCSGESATGEVSIVFQPLRNLSISSPGRLRQRNRVRSNIICMIIGAKVLLKYNIEGARCHPVRIARSPLALPRPCSQSTLSFSASCSH